MNKTIKAIVVFNEIMLACKKPVHSFKFFYPLFFFILFHSHSAWGIILSNSMTSTVAGATNHITYYMHPEDANNSATWYLVIDFHPVNQFDLSGVIFDYIGGAPNDFYIYNSLRTESRIPLRLVGSSADYNNTYSTTLVLSNVINPTVAGSYSNSAFLAKWNSIPTENRDYQVNPSTITIIPTEMERVEIQEETNANDFSEIIVIGVGGSITNYGIGYDVYSNHTGLTNLVWLLSDSSIGTNTSTGAIGTNVFTATNAGSLTLTASNSGSTETDTINIFVTNNVVSEVRIQLSNVAGAQISDGYSVSTDTNALSLFAVGYDSLGNYIGEITGDWTVSAATMGSFVGTTSGVSKVEFDFTNVIASPGSIDIDFTNTSLTISADYTPTEVFVGSPFRLEIQDSTNEGDYSVSANMGIGALVGITRNGVFYDEDGNYIGTTNNNLYWQVSDGSFGTNSVSNPGAGTNTFVATNTAGNVNLIVSNVSGISDSIAITITNSIEYIQIQLSNEQGAHIDPLVGLSSDSNQILYSVGYNEAGVYVGLVESDWAVSGSVGVFVGDSSGVGQVTVDVTNAGTGAPLGNVYATNATDTGVHTNLAINTTSAGEMVSIEIESGAGGGNERADITLAAGDEIPNYAVGYDGDGNHKALTNATWTVTGGIGTNTILSTTNTNIFVATTAGIGTLVIDNAVGSDSINVTVTNNSTLGRVEIQEETNANDFSGAMTINVGQSITNYGIGYDAYNNYIGLTNLVWLLSDSSIGTNTSTGAIGTNVFTATNAGSLTLTASNSGSTETDTINITVLNNAVSEVRIQLSNVAGAQISDGYSVSTDTNALSLFAVGYDSLGNYIGEITGDWTVSAATMGSFVGTTSGVSKVEFDFTNVIASPGSIDIDFTNTSLTISADYTPTEVFVGSPFRLEIQDSTNEGDYSVSANMGIGALVGITRNGVFYDEDGNYIGTTNNNLYWQVSDGSFGTNSVSNPGAGTNTFVATNTAGNVNLIVSNVSGISDSIAITITNSIEYIQIQLSNEQGAHIDPLVGLSSDSNQILYSVGYNEAGVYVGLVESDWAVSGSVGVFVGDSSGVGQVTVDVTNAGTGAPLGNVYATNATDTGVHTNLAINTTSAGEMVSIEIESGAGGGNERADITLAAGDEIPNYAVGYDGDGNHKALTNATWTVTGGIGTNTILSTTNTNIFVATTAGIGTLVIDNAVGSDSINVTVTNNSTLGRVEIQEETNANDFSGAMTINVGQSITNYGIGYDAYNNYIGLTNLVWLLSDSSIGTNTSTGAIGTNVFTATNAGSLTLTASNSGSTETDTINITVLNNAVSEVRIQLSNVAGAQISDGYSVSTDTNALSLFAVGYDSLGNYIGEITGDWTVSAATMGSFVGTTSGVSKVEFDFTNVIASPGSIDIDFTNTSLTISADYTPTEVFVGSPFRLEIQDSTNEGDYSVSANMGIGALVGITRNGVFYDEDGNYIGTTNNNLYWQVSDGSFGTNSVSNPGAGTNTFVATNTAGNVNLIVSNVSGISDSIAITITNSIEYIQIQLSNEQGAHIDPLVGLSSDSNQILYSVGYNEAGVYVGLVESDWAVSGSVGVFVGDSSGVGQVTVDVTNAGTGAPLGNVYATNATDTGVHTNLAINTTSAGEMVSIEIESGAGGGNERADITLAAGDEIPNYAVGYDGDGNHKALTNATWTVTGGIGTNTILSTTNTNIFVATTAGIGTLVIDNAVGSDSINVTVTNNSTLGRVEIQEETNANDFSGAMTINVGQSITNYGIGYDAYNNYIGLTNLVWLLSDSSIGTNTSTGAIGTNVFTATNAGSLTLTASNSGSTETDTINITVLNNAVSEVRIQLSNVAGAQISDGYSVSTDTNALSLFAVGYDSLGNYIGEITGDWTVSAATMGSFVGTTSGVSKVEFDFTNVIASPGSIDIDFTNTSLTISADYTPTEVFVGSPFRLEIQDSLSAGDYSVNTNMGIGTSAGITRNGVFYDEDGNYIGTTNNNLYWQVSDGSFGTNSVSNPGAGTNTFVATNTAGNVNLIVSNVSGISDSIAITITNSIEYIQIQLSNEQGAHIDPLVGLSSDSNQILYSVGYNEAGVYVGLVESDWAVSGSVGVFVGDSSGVGQVTVDVTNAGTGAPLGNVYATNATDTGVHTNLAINTTSAGEMVSIEIESGVGGGNERADITLAAGDEIPNYAVGYDGDGNHKALTNATWTVTGGIGTNTILSTTNTNIFVATTAGIGTLVIDNAVGSDSINVTVTNNSTLGRVEIQEETNANDFSGAMTINVGQSITNYGIGYDAYNNYIGLTNLVWLLSDSSIGTNTSTGAIGTNVFTATNAGSLTLTASNSGSTETDTINITVLNNAVSEVRIQLSNVAGAQISDGYSVSTDTNALSLFAVGYDSLGNYIGEITGDWTVSAATMGSFVGTTSGVSKVEFDFTNVIASPGSIDIDFTNTSLTISADYTPTEVFVGSPFRLEIQDSLSAGDYSVNTNMGIGTSAGITRNGVFYDEDGNYIGTTNNNLYWQVSDGSFGTNSVSNPGAGTNTFVATNTAGNVNLIVSNVSGISDSIAITITNSIEYIQIQLSNEQGAHIDPLVGLSSDSNQILYSVGYNEAGVYVGLVESDWAVSGSVGVFVGDSSGVGQVTVDVTNAGTGAPLGNVYATNATDTGVHTNLAINTTSAGEMVSIEIESGAGGGNERADITLAAGDEIPNYAVGYDGDGNHKALTNATWTVTGGIGTNTILSTTNTNIFVATTAGIGTLVIDNAVGSDSINVTVTNNSTLGRVEIQEETNANDFSGAMTINVGQSITNYGIGYDAYNNYIGLTNLVWLLSDSSIGTNTSTGAIGTNVFTATNAGSLTLTASNSGSTETDTINITVLNNAVSEVRIQLSNVAGAQISDGYSVSTDTNALSLFAVGYDSLGNYIGEITGDWTVSAATMGSFVGTTSGVSKVEFDFTNVIASPGSIDIDFTNTSLTISADYTPTEVFVGSPFRLEIQDSLSAGDYSVNTNMGIGTSAGITRNGVFYDEDGNYIGTTNNNLYWQVSDGSFGTNSVSNPGAGTNTFVATNTAGNVNLIVSNVSGISDSIAITITNSIEYIQIQLSNEQGAHIDPLVGLSSDSNQILYSVGYNEAGVYVGLVESDWAVSGSVGVFVGDSSGVGQVTVDVTNAGTGAPLGNVYATNATDTGVHTNLAINTTSAGEMVSIEIESGAGGGNERADITLAAGDEIPNYAVGYDGDGNHKALTNATWTVTGGIGTNTILSTTNTNIFVATTAGIGTLVIDNAVGSDSINVTVTNNSTLGRVEIQEETNANDFSGAMTINVGQSITNYGIGYDAYNNYIGLTNLVWLLSDSSIGTNTSTGAIGTNVFTATNAGSLTLTASNSGSTETDTINITVLNNAVSEVRIQLSNVAGAQISDGYSVSTDTNALSLFAVGYDSLGNYIGEITGDWTVSAATMGSFVGTTSGVSKVEFDFTNVIASPGSIDIDFTNTSLTISADYTPTEVFVGSPFRLEIQDSLSAGDYSVNTNMGIGTSAGITRNGVFYDEDGNYIGTTNNNLYWQVSDGSFGTNSVSNPGAGTNTFVATNTAGNVNLIVSNVSGISDSIAITITNSIEYIQIQLSNEQGAHIDPLVGLSSDSNQILYSVGYNEAGVYVGLVESDWAVSGSVGVFVGDSSGVGQVTVDVTNAGTGAPLGNVYATNATDTGVHTNLAINTTSAGEMVSIEIESGAGGGNERADITLAAGDEIPNYAVGYDGDGNHKALTNATWTVTGGIGTNTILSTTNTNIFVATTAGIGTLVIDNAVGSDSINVTVTNNSTLGRVEIQEETNANDFSGAMTINVGQSITNYGIGYDAYNNYIGLTNLVWLLSDSSIGTNTSTGAIGTNVFTATNAGSLTLIASNSGSTETDTINITVLNNAVSEVRIQLSNVAGAQISDGYSVSTDTNALSLFAVGYDSLGNYIGEITGDWTVSAATMGSFVGTTSGVSKVEFDFTNVIASPGSIDIDFTNTSLTISADYTPTEVFVGSPFRLEIQDSTNEGDYSVSANMGIGALVGITRNGVFYDEDGNYIGTTNNNLYWQVSDGSFGTNSVSNPGAGTNTFVATNTAGNVNLIVSNVSGISDSIAITITNSIEYIQIQLSNEQGAHIDPLVGLSSDSNQILYSVGYNEAGVYVGLVESDWAVSGSVGVFVGDSSGVGQVTVDVTNAGTGAPLGNVYATNATDTGVHTNLAINTTSAGEMVSIEIESGAGGGNERADITLAAGDEIPNYAVGYDADGNHKALTNATWTVTGGIGTNTILSTTNTNIFVATTVGIGTLVIDNAVGSDSINVTVTTGAENEIRLRDAPGGSGNLIMALTNVAGETNTLFAEIIDGYSNFIGDSPVGFFFSNSSASNGFISASTISNVEIVHWKEGTDHLIVTNSTGTISNAIEVTTLVGDPTGTIDLTFGVITNIVGTVTSITSSVVTDIAGNAATNAEFTVSGNLVSVTNADANNAVNGMQIASDVSGKLTFSVSNTGNAGVSSILAQSVGGNATGSTNLVYTSGISFLSMDILVNGLSKSSINSNQISDVIVVAYYTNASPSSFTRTADSLSFMFGGNVVSITESIVSHETNIAGNSLSSNVYELNVSNPALGSYVVTGNIQGSHGGNVNAINSETSGVQKTFNIIQPSELTTSWNLPITGLQGQPSTFSIQIENTGGADMTNVHVTNFSHSSNVTVVTGVPASLDIPFLAAGDSETLTWEITPTNSPGSISTIAMKVVGVDFNDPARTNENISLNGGEILVALSSAVRNFVGSLNDDDKFLYVGDTTEIFTLSISNVSTSTLSNYLQQLNFAVVDSLGNAVPANSAFSSLDFRTNDVLLTNATITSSSVISNTWGTNVFAFPPNETVEIQVFGNVKVIDKAFKLVIEGTSDILLSVGENSLNNANNLDVRGNTLANISSGFIATRNSEFAESLVSGPNPFNPFERPAVISFNLANSATVSAAIYTLTGNKVVDIIQGQSLSAGGHEFSWDGRNGNGHPVRSGVYILVVNNGSEIAQFKIAIAK